MSILYEHVTNVSEFYLNQNHLLQQDHLQEQLHFLLRLQHRPLLLVPCHLRTTTSERFLWKRAWWQLASSLLCRTMYWRSSYYMHTSNDAPMMKPRGTHLRPTNENLGVQNLETSIGPFLVRTTLRDKKMEAEIIWLCALGTSCQVSLSGHSLAYEILLYFEFFVAST